MINLFLFRMSSSTSFEITISMLLLQIKEKDNKIRKLEESNETLKARLKKMSIYEIKKYGTIRRETPSYHTKNKIKVALMTFNRDINQLGLHVNSVNFGKIGADVATDASEINESSKAPFKIVYSDTSNHLNKSEESTRNALYYKDLAMISDKQYKLIRTGWELEEQLPSLYQVSKLRKISNAEVNEKFNIKSIGNGFYLNPVTQIKNKILKYLKENFNKIHNNTMVIKLSCDGTNLSRKTKLVNLVFSLINEGKIAAAAAGCYRLGAFTIFKEDYEDLKTWLPQIWNEIKQLNKVFYDPINKLIFDEKDYEATRPQNLIEYDIQLFFSADWKATAIIKGYYAANGRWPCLYCMVDKLGINGLNFKGK